MKVWRLCLNICIVLGRGWVRLYCNITPPAQHSPAQTIPAQTGMQSPFVGAGVTFPDTDWEQQCNAHYDGRGRDIVSRLSVSLHKKICLWFMPLLLCPSQFCADATFENALSYSHPLENCSHRKLSPEATWINLYDFQYSCESKCFPCLHSIYAYENSLHHYQLLRWLVVLPYLCGVCSG